MGSLKMHPGSQMPSGRPGLHNWSYHGDDSGIHRTSSKPSSKLLSSQPSHSLQSFQLRSFQSFHSSAMAVPALKANIAAITMPSAKTNFMRPIQTLPPTIYLLSGARLVSPTFIKQFLATP